MQSVHYAARREPCGPHRHRLPEGSLSGLFIAVVTGAPVLLASCTAIGPTVPVALGAGKTTEAFGIDRRACMAATDRALQPVADRVNTLGTTPNQIAANNQGIQEAYNVSYVDCMAARGNVPSPGAVPAAAATSQYAPTLADTVMAPFAPADLRQGWRLLDMSYHAVSGRAVDANDALWRREVADPPAGPGSALPVYSISFADGARTVLLSVAGQGGDVCDDGPNTASSKRDYAVCPGKIGVVEDGRVAAIRPVGRLCVEAINAGGVRPGGPGWRDPSRWGTRARYDAVARTIEVATLQDGHAQPGCAKTMAVR